MVKAPEPPPCQRCCWYGCEATSAAHLHPDVTDTGCSLCECRAYIGPPRGGVFVVVLALVGLALVVLCLFGQIIGRIG